MTTFYVQSQFRGEKLDSATCFAVSHAGRWFLVTNRHVVTGVDQNTGFVHDEHGRVPDQLAICLPTGELGQDWYVHGEPLYDDDGAPLWTEHPTQAGRVDVVALEFHKPPQGRCFGATLDDPHDFPVTVGEPVTAIGYRGGEADFAFFAQWIECVLETPLADEQHALPRFLINGAIAGGSSGSPVVAHRDNAEALRRSDGSLIGSNWASRLLGVYSGRLISRESEDPAHQIGVVWNLQCLRDIINAAANKAG